MRLKIEDKIVEKLRFYASFCKFLYFLNLILKNKTHSSLANHIERVLTDIRDLR